MLSLSRFTSPRKIKLSVQILMTLDNWSLSSLPKMSLLFLRFISVFVTSHMANAPLRTASWTFCTFRSLLRSWTFIRSCQISLLHFFTRKSEQFCGFSYVFIFALNFSNALGFWQTLFAISARSLLIFSPISSSLWSSCIKPFRPESEPSSSDSLLVPKILFRLPASSLSSSAWRLTLSSYSCSYSSSSDPLWHSFLSSALALEEVILIFCFFFVLLICTSSLPSESDDVSELAFPSSDFLPVIRLFPLALALEGLFSTILLVRFWNLDISVPAKSWKVLFRYVCKSGCSCCFWLEHASSFTKYVGDRGCNAGSHVQKK